MVAVSGAAYQPGMPWIPDRDDARGHKARCREADAVLLARAVPLPVVVLHEPEIPPNTGNVARLCAATGCELVLAGRLGFSLDDRYLKRAGLDYWPAVKLRVAASLDEALAGYPGRNTWYFSTAGATPYWDVHFGPGDLLVFGKETAGLPADVLERAPDRVLRIPVLGTVRSLNLSSSVAAVVFEALRQRAHRHA